MPKGISPLMRFAMLRAYKALVVLPATLIGTVVLALALLGDQPLESSVKAIYEWADVSVRNAPPGTVMVFRCAGDLDSKVPRLPVLCEPIAKQAVPASAAISGTVSMFLQTYGVLVAVCAAGLLIYDFKRGALPARSGAR